MQTNNTSLIRDTVYSVLEDILDRPRTTFTLDDDFVRDLRITSDDLSFVFVPELERRLKLKAPVRAWRDVGNGWEAVKLMESLRGSAASGDIS